jgi:GNAT superfamily N-acetyltransferase
MTPDFRLVDCDDLNIEQISQIVDIAHAIRPDDFESVATLSDWHDAQRNAGRLCARWLALVGDRIVGSAYIGQTSWFPTDTTTLQVQVHPDHQSRGHGRVLLERAEATASERGAEKTFSWTEEEWPRSMRFLERAGYEPIERRWESSLHIPGCNLDELQESVDRVVSNGIRIESVTSLSAENTEWKSALYRLYAEVEQDMPTTFAIPKLRFEDFEAISLSRRFLGDGFFVALDGDVLVGLSEPQTVDAAPRTVSQRLTGVRSEYRNRGIAYALKARVAIWAAQAGYASIRTQNAASNAAMLAVNDRLGFERNRATVEYLKDLYAKATDVRPHRRR